MLVHVLRLPCVHGGHRFPPLLVTPGARRGEELMRHALCQAV